MIAQVRRDPEQFEIRWTLVTRCAPVHTMGANTGFACAWVQPRELRLSPWSQSIARATPKGMKYEVPGSMQIRYVSARNGPKYFIILTTERRLGASCENAAR